MSVSVWWHPLYRWYNTHSISDITSTVYMAQYALYVTSHPQFMTSQHSIHDIKLLYPTSHRLYLTARPLYLCHQTQIIDHTTPILCMITQPQYVWHHLNYIWPHFHSLCYHTTLWHHTFCIHVITPRIPVIASTVAGPLLIVYWLYHTYYMCEMKPTICGFYMNSIYSTGILCDITLTLYDKAILYSWHHIHSIHDSTPTLYDITYTILATSQPLYLWQDTSYVYDIILSIYDISHGVLVAIQPRYTQSHSQYLCNHTHLIDDITQNVCIKAHCQPSSRPFLL